MGKLIEGDDGLVVEEVGEWSKEKHEYLRRYLDISRATRKKYIGPNKGGAVYVDLFCSTGRAKIKNTTEYVDGSPIVAWNISRDGGAPFTAMYISDIDKTRLEACTERLKRLGAPVVSLHAPAVEAANHFARVIPQYSLKFAFIDPYSLGALDYRVIEAMGRLTRMDMLIHLSAMDINRNLLTNLKNDESDFDTFSPNWRERVDVRGTQQEVRRRVIEDWCNNLQSLGISTSTMWKLLTGSNNQPLYWLLLAAGHDLAHQFWKTALNVKGQQELFN